MCVYIRPLRHHIHRFHFSFPGSRNFFLVHLLGCAPSEASPPTSLQYVQKQTTQQQTHAVGVADSANAVSKLGSTRPSVFAFTFTTRRFCFSVVVAFPVAASLPVVCTVIPLHSVVSRFHRCKINRRSIRRYIIRVAPVPLLFFSLSLSLRCTRSPPLAQNPAYIKGNASTFWFCNSEATDLS